MKALLSAPMWAGGFGIAGAALVVAGVEMLAGRGWALITGGVFLLALFAVLIKGISRG